MASKRKGWEELSPTYRRRLTRQGVTPEAYARGESIRAARGHSRTPERLAGYEKLALDMGMAYVVPSYDEYREALTPAERGKLARDYVLGFMTPGSTKKPTKRNDARIMARMDFMRFVQEELDEPMDRDNWRAFRAAYNQHFGGKNS